MELKKLRDGKVETMGDDTDRRRYRRQGACNVVGVVRCGGHWCGDHPSSPLFQQLR